MAKQFSFKRCWKQSAHLRIGLVLFALVLLCALLAPLLETHDPYRLDGPAKAAPGGEYWLGTDALGGDVYSMMIEGTRTSLKVGFIAALISGVLGMLIGGAAGFIGGRTDRVISELINIFLMLPTFFLVLITVALFGSSMTNVMIIIGLTSWPGNARLMRVQAMSLKSACSSKAPRLWASRRPPSSSATSFPTASTPWWPTPPWALPAPSSWRPA